MKEKNSQLYYKDKKGVLISNQFIYEVLVYIYFDNFMSLAESKLFYSSIEIKNVVHLTKISNNIQIECELYAAPKQWLLDNNYIKYEKLKKNEKGSKIIKSNSRKSFNKSS